jgi:L-serine dehydratase
MFVSAFDLFKIGLGPSSSHTVGPMRAALSFVHTVEAEGKLASIERLGVDLYGSLALTGRGHGTDRAVLLGLSGEAPDRVDPDQVEAKVKRIRESQLLRLDGRRDVRFVERDDLRFRIDKTLAFHSNGMRFTAYDAAGTILARRTYFSVGGGFVVEEAETQHIVDAARTPHVPYPFGNAAELLEQGRLSGKRIPELMRVNEYALHSPDEVRAGLLERWAVMNACIDRGMQSEGVLPGGLNVRRRAKGLAAGLRERRARHEPNPNEAMDWASVYADASSPRRPMARPASSPQCCATTVSSTTITATRAWFPTFSLQPQSAGCASAMHRCPAPKSVARVRSASLARWPRPDSPPCSAAPTPRSKMPPRSASSITSA